jgi:hypothetical protein
MMATIVNTMIAGSAQASKIIPQPFTLALWQKNEGTCELEATTVVSNDANSPLIFSASQAPRVFSSSFRRGHKLCSSVVNWQKSEEDGWGSEMSDRARKSRGENHAAHQVNPQNDDEERDCVDGSRSCYNSRRPGKRVSNLEENNNFVQDWCERKRRGR